MLFLLFRYFSHDSVTRWIGIAAAIVDTIEIADSRRVDMHEYLSVSSNSRVQHPMYTSDDNSSEVGWLLGTPQHHEPNYNFDNDDSRSSNHSLNMISSSLI